MYTQFFNLKQAPFSIAPDPRYLLMTHGHREALAHLMYGINSGGGLVLLTGEVGAGKTTVCRCFLEQVPSNCNVAYIFNPKLTVNELLRAICDEFRIAFRHEGPGSATVKDYVDALTAYLLRTHADGQNNVLIIDEAQNLSADVLEQLRLLTNLETNERKLLQIILIGQPELRTMLERPEMKQLAQRVIARYHLDALSEQETASYIRHRLLVAGSSSAPPFAPSLAKQIHGITQGVPRRINLLCDRALLGAYAENKYEVSRDIVHRAAQEIFGKEGTASHGSARKKLHAASALATLALVAGAAAWMINQDVGLAALGRSIGATKAGTRAAVSSATPAGASLRNPAENASASEPVRRSGEAVQSAGTKILSEQNGAPVGGLTNRDDAYRQLAQLWGVALEGGAPCTVAPEKDLHCYESSNGFAELRQLDRPAVLALRGGGKETSYVLVTDVTDSTATLRAGELTQTVNLVLLGRYFSGDFGTFWRAPAAYRRSVRLGDQGTDADWIAAQLAKLSSAPAPAAHQPFDQKIVKQVRDFQLAQGLDVDGVVGPVTFMHLNRAVGINEPRLRNGATATAKAARE